MKRLAVKVDTEQQFEAVVEHNLNNGFKMIGGVNRSYDESCNVVEIGSNYRVYNINSPYAWTNRVLNFIAFKAFIYNKN